MRVPSCTMDMLVAVIVAANSQTKAEAAVKLGISISALEKRLRAAGTVVGADLIRYGAGRTVLTEEGRIFYAQALRSVELALLAEESTRAHMALKMNQLMVGHSTYLAPSLLTMIQRLKLVEHPFVQLRHTTGLTAAIAQSVIEGKLHAGFGFLPLSSPELSIWKIWDEPLVACIPASHPLSSRSVLRAQDLHEQPFVAVAREAIPALHQEIEKYLGSLAVTLHITADAYTPTEALVLVEQRIGLCLLARSSAMARRGVVVRPLSAQVLVRHSGFFVREDNRNPLVLELSSIVLKQTAGLRRL